MVEKGASYPLSPRTMLNRPQRTISGPATLKKDPHRSMNASAFTLSLLREVLPNPISVTQTPRASERMPSIVAEIIRFNARNCFGCLLLRVRCVGLRLTSKMSHDLRRRGSCCITILILLLHFDKMYNSTRRDGEGRWLWRLVRRFGFLHVNRAQRVSKACSNETLEQ